MTHPQDILSHRGHDLNGSGGEKIGTIEEIYLDTETNQPEWALVHTGLFGTKRSFVPLKEAADHAMTRSDEELPVSTAEREAGRVRLRKYVVEDQVTQTVPMRRETARL